MVVVIEIYINLSSIIFYPYPNSRAKSTPLINHLLEKTKCLHIPEIFGHPKMYFLQNIEKFFFRAKGAIATWYAPLECFLLEI